MGEVRRKYVRSLTINNRLFEEVVIDSYYELKHSDITDEVILNLVVLLDGRIIDLVGLKDGFTYLAPEVKWEEKSYRLVLTYCHESFLGVVNAFRVKEKKL